MVSRCLCPILSFCRLSTYTSRNVKTPPHPTTPTARASPTTLHTQPRSVHHLTTKTTHLRYHPQLATVMLIFHIINYPGAPWIVCGLPSCLTVVKCNYTRATVGRFGRRRHNCCVYREAFRGVSRVKTSVSAPVERGQRSPAMRSVQCTGWGLTALITAANGGSSYQSMGEFGDDADG